MNQTLGLIPASVLVFAAVTLLVSLLGAMLYVPMRRYLRRLPPAAEAGLLLAFAGAPALAGLSLVALALSPSLAHLLGIAVDHCHQHGHHAHFCPTHTPLWVGSSLDWLILTAAVLAVASMAGDLPRRLWRVRRTVRILERLHQSSPKSESWGVVDTDAPLAVTAGLIRPRIYLSTRLLDALSPTELAVVVEHEQAHRRRREGPRPLVAELLARMHLAPIRKRLLADLSLASERACDEEAALAASGRLGVAQTLLKVARLNGAHPEPSDALLPTVTGADLEARVEAMLRPASAQRPMLRPLFFLGASLVLAFGGIHADRLHHGIESALHLLIL